MIYRWKWLRAWRLDVLHESGPLAARQECAKLFNNRRFWWQKELEIPE